MSQQTSIQAQIDNETITCDAALPGGSPWAGKLVRFVEQPEDSEEPPTVRACTSGEDMPCGWLESVDTAGVATIVVQGPWPRGVRSARTL